MLNDNIKAFISTTISLYNVEILSQEIINEGVENLKKAKELLLEQDNGTTLEKTFSIDV